MQSILTYIYIYIFYFILFIYLYLCLYLFIYIKDSLNTFVFSKRTLHFMIKELGKTLVQNVAKYWQTPMPSSRITTKDAITFFILYIVSQSSAGGVAFTETKAARSSGMFYLGVQPRGFRCVVYISFHNYDYCSEILTFVYISLIIFNAFIMVFE